MNTNMDLMTTEIEKKEGLEIGKAMEAFADDDMVEVPVKLLKFLVGYAKGATANSFSGDATYLAFCKGCDASGIDSKQAKVMYRALVDSMNPLALMDRRMDSFADAKNVVKDDDKLIGDPGDAKRPRISDNSNRRRNDPSRIEMQEKAARDDSGRTGRGSRSVRRRSPRMGVRTNSHPENGRSADQHDGSEPLSDV